MSTESAPISRRGILSLLGCGLIAPVALDPPQSPDPALEIWDGGAP